VERMRCMDDSVLSERHGRVKRPRRIDVMDARLDAASSRFARAVFSR
jgi:hypothetical protein